MRYLFILFLLGFLSMSNASEHNQDQGLRHIVVFKYKPEASQQDIDKVTNTLRSLKDKIPGILRFEYGINNSPEGLDQGFTHVYQFTFVDAAARDHYLPHPEHAKFGQLLGELDILESVFVVDYPINE